MNNVKLYASAGLVVVALAHALVLGLVLSSNQSDMIKRSQPTVVEVPQYQPQVSYPQISGSQSGLNTSALNENKQGLGDGFTRVYNPNTGEHVPVPNQFVSPKTTPQGIPQSILEQKTQGARSQAGPCFPCQQPRVVQQPYYVAPYTYSQPYTPAPTYTPVPYTPAPQVPLALARPSNKPDKLALFINGSAKSQEVLQWFSRNPELRSLKNFCEYQVYSPNDTLYRERYARIVPVEAMPAVIWMHQPPGDVNGKQAALVAGLGGSDIVSESQLVADLKQGYAMLKHVKESAASQPEMNWYQPPRLTESQFWQTFAAPTLVLNQASLGDEYGNPPCVGPNCPYPPQPTQPNVLQPDDGRDWRHPFADRDPVRGPVLDLARMPQETMVACVILIIGALVAFGIMNSKKANG